MGKWIKAVAGIVVVSFWVGCSSSGNDKATQSSKEISKNGIEYAETMSAFNEIIKGEQPVLVDFYADWCAPCRMMAPILEQVAGEMQGKVKILKVNVDKNRDATMKYGIQSIPTLMLFQGGEVKWKGVGVIQADQIKQIVLSKTN